MPALDVSLLNVDTFVRVNALKEVTNPIYLQKNVPTPDGILSYDIFGTAISDRQTRMAYIDLKGYYMSPAAAKKLRSYDRRLDDILFSLDRYTLTKDGNLVKDPEGETGPDFLYKIWGKVKVKEKTSIITKEVEKFFEQERNELFISKLPVIPAFFRDINTSSTEKLSTHEINDLYSSIISYCQNVNTYTDTFGTIKNITKSRIQSLLIDLEDLLLVKKVKGQPAKYGLLRKYVMSKNIDYSSRLVISSPILMADAPDSMPIKYGYVGLPLAHVCSGFFPFMVQALKRFFDAEFIRGGKYPVYDADGKETFCTIEESYDENAITKMITKFINSPGSRFDRIPIPANDSGKDLYMILTGRFMKENTTIKRYATLTDILYIIANDVVADKHVYITRYPLESYNGQFPAKIFVATTIKTAPVMIGTKVYQYYPVIDGNPANSFSDTLQMSNTYLAELGGDYDGDTVSVKPVFTVEGNLDCDRQINSKAYLLDMAGKLMRGISKDFIITGYVLTKCEVELADINEKPPLYKI